MTTEAKDVVTGSSSPGCGKTPPIVKGTGIESSGTGLGGCNALNLERRTDPRQHTSTSTAALTGFHGNRTVTDGACLLPPPEEHTLEQARCALRPPCRLESSYPEHGGSEVWTARRGEGGSGRRSDTPRVSPDQADGNGHKPSGSVRKSWPLSRKLYSARRYHPHLCRNPSEC